MRVDVERVVPLEYAAKLGRHPFGEVQGIRLPIRSTSRWGIARSRLQIVDAAVRQQQRIAARHDHIADSRDAPRVAERRFDCASESSRVAHLAPAGAEAAVRGAHRGHQKERAVGIAVRDVGTGEFASSSSESTSPSWTSSSCTVGRTAANGVAGRFDQVHHRGRDAELEVFGRPGGDAHLPDVLRTKRAARASSDAMLFLRSSFLPGLHSQLLGVITRSSPARSTPGWSRSWCSRAFRKIHGSVRNRPARTFRRQSAGSVAISRRSTSLSSCDPTPAPCRSRSTAIQ